MHITLNEAMRQIRAMGLTVSRTQYHEFRINLRPESGGTVDSAYYVTDTEDAIQTARMMALAATGTRL